LAKVPIKKAYPDSLSICPPNLPWKAHIINVSNFSASSYILYQLLLSSPSLSHSCSFSVRFSIGERRSIEEGLKSQGSGRRFGLSELGRARLSGILSLDRKEGGSSPSTLR